VEWDEADADDEQRRGRAQRPWQGNSKHRTKAQAKRKGPLASAKIPSYCKDHLWLSLRQAIPHSEKTYMNTEKAFLHFNWACNVISPDLAVSEQDCVKIPKMAFSH